MIARDRSLLGTVSRTSGRYVQGKSGSTSIGCEIDMVCLWLAKLCSPSIVHRRLTVRVGCSHGSIPCGVLDSIPHRM